MSDQIVRSEAIPNLSAHDHWPITEHGCQATIARDHLLTSARYGSSTLFDHSLLWIKPCTGVPVRMRRGWRRVNLVLTPWVTSSQAARERIN